MPTTLSGKPWEGKDQTIFNLQGKLMNAVMTYNLAEVEELLYAGADAFARSYEMSDERNVSRRRCFFIDFPMISTTSWPTVTINLCARGRELIRRIRMHNPTAWTR